MNNLVDAAKEFVRPFISYLMALTLALMTFIAFIRFCTPEMAKDIVVGFIAMAGPVVGYYFASRQNNENLIKIRDLETKIRMLESTRTGPDSPAK